MCTVKNHDNCFLNQRLALIVNSHTHYRMSYLTDQSTPAGLSLCLGCGLLATSPSSYRNGMGRGGSAQSQGGAGTASILLLPYHLHHRAAAVCLCTQRRRNNVCSISHTSMHGNETVSLIQVRDQWTLVMKWFIYSCSDDTAINMHWLGIATIWRLLNSFCGNTSSLKCLAWQKGGRGGNKPNHGPRTKTNTQK